LEDFDAREELNYGMKGYFFRVHGGRVGSLLKESHLRIATILLTAALLVPVPAAIAQTTIGFADPSDLETLLDYRLPDWGYHRWDARLSLDGSGRNEGDYDRSRNHGLFTSSGFIYRESEKRILRLSALGRGTYSNEDRGWDANEDREEMSYTHDRFDLQIYLAGDLQRYVGTSDYFARGLVSGSAMYRETGDDRMEGDETSESTHYTRRYDYSAAGTMGVGRMRVITPILRAKRLSERLVALGRTPLTPDQVMRAAEVFAQVTGYSSSYDRVSRRLWRDVFESVVDPDQPLSIYEIE